jgi:uncharacterized membrane protein
MASKGKKREPEPRQAEAPGVDWLVVGLSAAGFLVAGYLTWLKWAAHGAFLCAAGGGCDLVQASRYSIFLGVPTALWGVLLYVAIGILGGMGLTTGRWVAAFLLAAAGVGFSVYITALSLFVVGGACMYCLTSGAIEVALLVVLLWHRPPAAVNRPCARSRWQATERWRLSRPSSSAPSCSRHLHPRLRATNPRSPGTSSRRGRSCTVPTGDPRAKSKKPGSGLPRKSCRTLSVTRRASIPVPTSASKSACRNIPPGSLATSAMRAFCRSID